MSLTLPPKEDKPTKEELAIVLNLVSCAAVKPAASPAATDKPPVAIIDNIIGNWLATDCSAYSPTSAKSLISPNCWSLLYSSDTSSL